MFRAEYLSIIKQEVKDIRKQYGLSENIPICDYIFTILKNECILVEWPENEQLDLDGFSTEKVVNGKLQTLVYINTAKNKEKQNFCAAHELGHRHNLESQIRDQFPDEVLTQSVIEDIMNRFAAELMMPEGDFKKRGRKLYSKCLFCEGNRQFISVKMLMESIIQLMDFYYVPYKSVVLRMSEVGIIAGHTCKYLLKYEQTDDGKNVIEFCIKGCGITRLRTPDRKVQYSVPLDGIYDIISDVRISRYMNPNELKEYLKNMGLAEADIQLINEMKKINDERIDIENI
jgi:Zn-dependent peptidase ImmA (M78 family)